MSAPAPLPTGPFAGGLIQFDKEKQFLNGDASAGIEVTADADRDVLEAILKDTPFPDRQIELGKITVKAEANHDIMFDGSRGQVKFNGSASAFAGLGVYKDTGALLSVISPPDETAPGFDFKAPAGSAFLLLRWGFDLQASAQGSVALGIGSSATFGVDGRKEGLFAAIRCFPRPVGARTELTSLAQSWIMPARIKTCSQLEPGTWIFAEIDGSLALKIGAQFGYNFNWIHALPAGISGDIGLRIQLGASVALGFSTQGKYGVVLARESLNPADQVLRLRLFKLAKKGWDFAFNAGVSVTPSTTGMPQDYKEFIGAVFGLHSAQFLKDLQLFNEWSDSTRPLSGLFADVAVNEGLDLLHTVTGIDPQAEFDKAKNFLTHLLNQWDQLPHEVATAIWKLIPQPGALDRISAIAKQIGTATSDSLQALLEKELSNVSFFQTPVGQWLESAAGGGVLDALTSSTVFAKLQKVANLTASILDGSELQSALGRLQAFIDTKLDINQIRTTLDQATFDKLNGWLKAKLSAFLGSKIDFQAFNKIRDAVHKLDTMGQSFYDKAIQALNRKYSFDFSATYQSSTTRTALIDVEFDFSVNNPNLTSLLQNALDGNCADLLLTTAPGVNLKLGTLTHEVQRHSHIDVTLPYFKSDIDHFNKALAQVNAVQESDGRLLVYDLDASDVVTVSNRRQSSLTIGAHLDVPANHVVRHSTSSLSYSYSYKQAVKNMRSSQFHSQLKPYVSTYLPKLFPGDTTGSASGSFDAWVNDLDRFIDGVDPNGTGNIGNTLLSLELSLPEEVVASWLSAPGDNKSDPVYQEYMEMSRKLQAKLKELIPFYFFADPGNFKNRAPAQTLLAWAAIPPSSSASLTDGALTLNTNRDVFWDWPEPDFRRAFLHNAKTSAALSRLLQDVSNRLLAAPGMEGLAADYDPRSIESILAVAENSQLLQSLLFVEATLIRRAQSAGLDLAKFRVAANADPPQAIALLANFGSEITSTFNSKLSIFGGDATRPLGTMLFVEAASAFNQIQAKRAAVAKFDVVVLRGSAAFPPTGFPDNAPPDPKDVVCSQVLLNLGS